MKVNLSQREIEYLLYLITESVENATENGAVTNEYTEEDLELMDKLETALKAMENENLGFGTKSRQLN